MVAVQDTGVGSGTSLRRKFPTWLVALAILALLRRSSRLLVPLRSSCFPLGIIGTGLLAIPILAASGAYAVKEFFGVRGGLADKARYRPFFYGVLASGMLGGLAINYVGIDPIKALFATAVINGLVAPPLLILITLLGGVASGSVQVVRNGA